MIILLTIKRISGIIDIYNILVLEEKLMNKKILSLALACTMLAATVAQAAENLSDYVKNNAAYADYLENNLFSYSKYNEKLNKTPKEVAPEIVTEVKLSLTIRPLRVNLKFLLHMTAQNLLMRH